MVFFNYYQLKSKFLIIRNIFSLLIGTIEIHCNQIHSPTLDHDHPCILNKSIQIFIICFIWTLYPSLYHVYILYNYIYRCISIGLCISMRTTVTCKGIIIYYQDRLRPLSNINPLNNSV